MDLGCHYSVFSRNRRCLFCCVYLGTHAIMLEWRRKHVKKRQNLTKKPEVVPYKLQFYIVSKKSYHPFDFLVLVVLAVSNTVLNKLLYLFHLTYSLWFFYYFFNSKFLLVCFLQFLFVECYNNFFSIKITKYICPFFNFFNHKNFFRRI